MKTIIKINGDAYLLPAGVNMSAILDTLSQATPLGSNSSPRKGEPQYVIDDNAHTILTIEVLADDMVGKKVVPPPREPKEAEQV